jgi:nitrate/nitrite-specific signal transduction histidine kinase
MLKYWAEEQHKLITKHNELIDSAREMSFQLKKQNQDLIEKQDYELNLATVNERNRIAREIHDNVGHLLSSAILQSAALYTVTKDEKIREGLNSINNTLNEAMSSIEMYSMTFVIKICDLRHLQALKNQSMINISNGGGELNGCKGKKSC